jgi:hypothetical protein
MKHLAVYVVFVAQSLSQSGNAQQQSLTVEDLRLQPSVRITPPKIGVSTPEPRDPPPPQERAIVPLARPDYAPWNREILASVKDMPSGGSYSVKATALNNLKSSATIDPKRKSLKVKASVAQPSFCSGATYLVLLETLSRLQARNKLHLSDTVCAVLADIGKPDGVGIWGRWNANGPGTASLLYHLGAGPSFTQIEDAQPGDFLKIWWNQHIGSKERGHSVIYLGGGRNDEIGPDHIKFWSSNIPDGYGTKIIPLADAKRLLFTRLENPQAFANISRLKSQDDFLASMLTRSVTEGEMFLQLGISAPAAPITEPDVIKAVPLGSPTEHTRRSTQAEEISEPSVASPGNEGSLMTRQEMFAVSSYASSGNLTQIAILREIQARLNDLGFYKGLPDGDTGPATHKALTAFQTSIKQKPTGLLDEDTLHALGIKANPGAK